MKHLVLTLIPPPTRDAGEDAERYDLIPDEAMALVWDQVTHLHVLRAWPCWLRSLRRPSRAAARWAPVTLSLN